MTSPRLPAFFLLLIAGVSGLAFDKPEIAEFKAHGGNISATAISDDGKAVLTGEDNGNVMLWDVKTGALIHKYMGHTRGVLGAALLPDGKRAVTCGDDSLVIIWDLASGKRLHEMHTGDSIPVVMACTAHGSLAATGCDDGQIVIWDLADGRRVTTLRHTSPLCSVLFSPDGKSLAAGYSDGRVILWSTIGWTEKHTLPSADQASVGALGFSPDSRLLATGNQNGSGSVWNVAAGTQCSSFAGYANPEAAPSPPAAPVFTGSPLTPSSRGSIVFLCFSPDAKSIFGSIQNGAPRFWETKTGKLLGTGDWFGDTRFYVARYGFPFSTAAVSRGRDFIVTFKFSADDYPEYFLAQVWQMSFVPGAAAQQ
jgi:WD40 repeat protein